MSIRRRRECSSCGWRFTTYERVEENVPLVVKRNGTREPFNRNKILSGILRACEKRNISFDLVQEIVSRIEAEIVSSGEREVSTRVIGEKVMNELRKLDDVAYVRFASVYRQFKDLSQFMEEIRSIYDKPTSKNNRDE